MAKKTKNPKLGKHLVRYVKDSEPKLKFFDNKKKLNSFVAKFVKKHPNSHDGYWIDFVCYDVGSFVAIDVCLESELA